MIKTLFETLDLSIDNRRQREKKATSNLIFRALGYKDIIAYRHDGSPYLPGTDVNISISHSKNFAAIALSDSDCPFGIDIEEPRHAQLLKVARRFLTTEEFDYYSRFEGGLLKAWTLKEAAYKALRHGPADLRLYSLPLDDTADNIIVDNTRLTIFRSQLILPTLMVSIVVNG